MESEQSETLTAYAVYARKWGMHPDPEIQALLVKKHPARYDLRGRPVSIWDWRHPANSSRFEEYTDTPTAPEALPQTLQDATSPDGNEVRRLDGILAEVRLLTTRVNVLSERANQRQVVSAF